MRWIIILLIAVAVYQAFTPYVGSTGRIVTPTEISSLSADVQLVDSKDITRLLTKAKKPTVMMFYASWCNYCNALMPAIHSLWQEGVFKNTNLVFISIDTELSPISSYLLRKDYLTMVGSSPHVLRQDTRPALYAALAARGSTYKGGIPYIGFFNKNGQIVLELLGLVTRDAIRDAVKELEQ